MGTNTCSGISITPTQIAPIGDQADLVIGADGFFQAGSSLTVLTPITISDAGDWSEISPAGFTPGMGTVNFTSATSQTINDDNTTFFTLMHSGAGTLNFTASPSPLLVEGDFVNSSGTVNANGESMMIGANWNDTSSVVSIATVTFTPFFLGVQTVTSNSNFQNVTYAGPPPGKLQLLTPVTLTGNFTVSFGIVDANGQDMTVAGNWSNMGTVENTNNVTFNGGTGVTQLLDNGSLGLMNSLNNVIHSGASTVKLSNNSLVVTGTLDNSAGSFDANGSNVTISGLTTIIDSTVENTGGNPAETITLNGGLSMTGGVLSSGAGVAILGAGVAATADIFGPSFIEGNLDLGGANRTFTIGQSGQARDLIVPARITNVRRASTDLITNGNFEQGNTGFTSAYIYSPGNIGPADTYDVLPNPRPAHGGDTASYGDHSTGMGLMMAVNGAETPGVVVWSESFSVVPESDYAFSMWISSWTAGSPATFDIQFNGVSVGTPSAPFPAAVWQQFSTNWNSGADTTLTIQIFDTNLNDGGNDFAFDDISLIGPAQVGRITKDGGGIMELANTNQYDGGTNIIAGILDVSQDGALGVGTGGTTVAAGGILQFSGNVTYNTPEVVTLNGGTIRAETSSGPNIFAGPIFLNASGNSLGTNMNGVNSLLVLNGAINAGGFDLTVKGDGFFVLNGPINGTSAATLTMQGTAFLTLNGASTYGGGTTVNSGLLNIGNDSAVGTGTLTMGEGTVIAVSGASHTLGNNVVLNSSVVVGASANTLILNGVVSGFATLIVSGNLTLNGNNSFTNTIVEAATLGVGNNNALGSTLALDDGSVLISVGGPHSISVPIEVTGSTTVAGSNDFTISGMISGGGSLADSDTGTLTLESTNSYSGGTTVTAGTLALLGGDVGSGPLTLDDGSTLSSLVGQGLNNAVTLNGISTIDVSGGQFQFNGVIGGTGGFTLAGPGPLLLFGNNIYSGTTTLNGGSLVVFGLQPASPIIINKGATLLGTGSVGAVTVNNGGILEPEHAPPFVQATMVTGNLQFNSGGIFSVSVIGPSRVVGSTTPVRVNGTVNLGPGNATLKVSAIFQPDAGDKFLWIDNLGATPISGFFAGPPEGNVIDSNGRRFLISYQGGDGNDVVGIAVPRFDISGRVSSNGQWWIGQSNGSGFSNTFATSWSTAVTWVDVHTGDFTGNGLQDIVGRVKENGQWWMSVPNGSGGWTTHLWDTWSTGVTWVDVQVGDFDGDGKMDIVGRAQEIGQWWIAQSTGGSFTNHLWATWSTAATWVDVHVGDFNGDGKADITGRWLQGGNWWTGVSNGAMFTTTPWGQWSPVATWVDVNVGDFNGDGKADIVGRWSQAGQWWAAISTGSSFTNSLWTAWSTAVTWVDVNVGDFNGDGKADIVGHALELGQWWVAQSTGTSFTNNLWATWSSAATWVDVQVGDFNGDGKMDIAGRWQQAGSWWTATSTGTSFATTNWTLWSTAVTWVDVQNGVYV
jgi:autotransporter-associated beta strand protein